MDNWILDLSKEKAIDRVQPLSTLWYENGKGERLYPTGDVYPEEFFDKGFKYQHTLIPVLEESICTDEGETARGTTTMNTIDRIVLYLMQERGWSLVDAVTLACSTCERCLNILLEEAGGEPYSEDEKNKCNTHCELCIVIDPEYDVKYRRKEQLRESIVLNEIKQKVYSYMETISRRIVGVITNENKKVLQEKIAELIKEVYTDPLTGLYNRKFLEEKFSELAQSQYHMIVLDLDNFKEINDTYGHDIGDEVLKRVALQIDSLTREGDFVCRFGGEEFIILCSNGDIKLIQKLAERIRDAIADLDINGIKITTSAGVANYNKSTKDTFKRADKALYASKALGKNKVMVYDGSMQNEYHNPMI